MTGKNSESKFFKACMKCKSPDIKIFPGDDNDYFGLNPKYECRSCGSVGPAVEFPEKLKKPWNPGK